ncbi:hypothetical protein J2751_001348 [Halorubrum alkaliphilum]|uniref:Uncharacterized protein n=1 Tax=Halorubrum alkaliphilum TaxID=261290 RepID=A0A8T4GFA9_9EURY|nr:hypothetical protein [Halorubrum alkaliphilum]MBP1922340.1 hypothetical protein [Halorubrum alkaliphilum]
MYVDPGRIRRSLLEVAPRVPQWGRVVDGDWESEWEPFHERAVPQGIEQRYLGGRNWRDTALFDAFRDQLNRFGNAWGYTDEAEFSERCREIDRLHDSIRDGGYRRQEDLHGPDGYATTARFDEINVDIGREGEIYWRSYGQHRLALATLLDIDSVPVIVHRRHAAWQAVRDATDRSAGCATAVHPDLREATNRETVPARHKNKKQFGLMG